MRNKIKFLVISFILLFSFTISVSANTIDLNELGSVEVLLKEESNNIKGAEITLFHIGNAKNSNNNLSFELVDELSGCNVDLSDLTNDNLTNEILKCNIENTTKYVEVTNSNGIVKFNNLTLGLYLVKETNSVEGYSNIDSFLVQIPNIENNKWILDVKAKPKTEIYKVIDITIEKKWNTKTQEIPKEVTIELYENNTLIESVLLNNDNNWTYTFEDMKASDKYSVKEVNVPKGFTPSYTVNNNIFTVTNTDTLAFTGQTFYPIIILSTLGMLLIFAGIKVIKNEA